MEPHGRKSPDYALSALGARRDSGGRRRGVAAAEAVLITPLLLVCVWLLFFYGGAMIHKQKVIKAAHAGTWSHVRVFTDRPHGHPPYDPTQTTPDPTQFFVFAGDPGHDRRIAVMYYLTSQTDPQVEPDESETTGGLGRLLAGFASGSPQAQAGSSYIRGGISDSFQTETWRVTATYDTQMVRWLGANINREVSSRFRMDIGTWQNFDYRAALNMLPATAAEDAMVISTISAVAALQLFPQQVPTLLIRLSVTR